MKTNIKTIRSIKTIQIYLTAGIFATPFLWFLAGIFMPFLFLELFIAILAGIVEYVWISAIDNELEKLSKDIQNKKVRKWNKKVENSL